MRNTAIWTARTGAATLAGAALMLALTHPLPTAAQEMGHSLDLNRGWTGFYAGAHGGYVGGGGWTGDFFYADTDLAHGYRLDAEGWAGGLQIGVNRQLGAMVASIEADVSFGSIEDSGRFEANGLTGHGARVVWEMSERMERFGTVRGRLGYLPMANLLVYATGGLAWAETQAGQVIHYPDDIPTPNVNGFGAVKEIHLGWTAGLGAEWLLGPHFTLRAEYLYLDLGRQDYHLVGKAGMPPTVFYAADSAPSTLDFHIFRLGLNALFN